MLKRALDVGWFILMAPLLALVSVLIASGMMALILTSKFLDRRDGHA